MKLSSLATLALVTAIVFSSCKKDDAPAAPAPYYVGKWSYNSIKNDYYNWPQYQANGSFSLDSTRTFNISTLGLYFEFNGDKTFNHYFINSSGGLQLYTGKYFVDSSSTGTDPKFNLMYSSSPSDTIEYGISGRSATTLQLNQTYRSSANTPDSLVKITDQFTNLIKQ